MDKDKKKIVSLVEKKKVNSDAVALLERTLKRAKNGDLSRVGIVYHTTENGWGSAFSATDNTLEDSAMLIEVGLRRLGFTVKD